MTNEEKELLTRDLCARLPYGVIVEYGCKHEGKDLGERKSKLTGRMIDSFFGSMQIGMSEVYSLQPYLRPMSSMTEDEFKDLKSYSGLMYDQLELPEFFNNSKCLEFYLSEIPSYVVILVFDWLNSYHFDYRDLIPLGLALEAPEGMYK